LLTDTGRRQTEDIQKAIAAGRYEGCPINKKLHQGIGELLEASLSVRDIASNLGCSTSTVQRVKKDRASP